MHPSRTAYLAYFFSGFTCNQQLQETRFRSRVYRRDLGMKCITYILRIGFFIWVYVTSKIQIKLDLSPWGSVWCTFTSQSCCIPDFGAINNTIYYQFPFTHQIYTFSSCTDFLIMELDTTPRERNKMTYSTIGSIWLYTYV